MPILYRALRLLMGSVLAASICLTAVSAQGRVSGEFGIAAVQDFDAAGGCPTRFDYEVLASAADSGNLLGLSAYRFRHDIRYSTLSLGGFQRVAHRPERATTDCRFHREKTLQQRD
jgi:hypothetical protein